MTYLFLHHIMHYYAMLLFLSPDWLTKSALHTLYYSLVYSYLRYCIVVWGCSNPTNLNRLVLLQKRVVRIVSKEAFDAHTEPIFKALKILKFHQIYLFHIGKFMYLYHNNMLPRSFDKFFLRVNQVHNLNTRSSNLYYLPFCRTKIRQSTINYQGPKFFNTLTEDICDASSVACFQFKLKKKKVSSYLISPKYSFGSLT